MPAKLNTNNKLVEISIEKNLLFIGLLLILLDIEGKEPSYINLSNFGSLGRAAMFKFKQLGRTITHIFSDIHK